MRMRAWLCGVGLGAALLAAGGCDVVALHAAGVEGTFERTLTVNGPVSLDVWTGSGDIQVRPGSDSSVRVVAHVKAQASVLGDTPEARIAQIQARPPIEQAGNAVRIGVQHDDPLYRNVSISYELTVPAHTKVLARSGSGDVSIAITADEVDARTGSGDINVVGTSGRFEAHTGSGDVRAGRVAGAIKASTGSGDVEAAQTVAAPIEVRTGSGDVTMSVPDGAAFTLDVHTGSGAIRTSQPVANSARGRNSLEGTVRGGGPTVLIRTGSGSVTID
jgi:Toastrack DUF4097